MLSCVFKNKSEIRKLLNLCYGFLFLNPDGVNNYFYENLMNHNLSDQKIDNFLIIKKKKNYNSLENKFQLSIWPIFINYQTR